MKSLFKSRHLEISLIKGFVFGLGVNDSNTNLIIMIGFIAFEIDLPKKKNKSPYEVEF